MNDRAAHTHSRALPPVLLALGLASAGCPGKGGAGDGTAAVTTAVPSSGKIARPHRPATPAGPIAPDSSATTAQPPPDDPLFPRATLVELYKADLLLDAPGRRAVLARYGLVDSSGKEDPTRVQAYEAALKRFAEARPDEWSALADEIEAARAKAPPPSDVPGR